MEEHMNSDNHVLHLSVSKDMNFLLQIFKYLHSAVVIFPRSGSTLLENQVKTYKIFYNYTEDTDKKFPQAEKNFLLSV